MATEVLEVGSAVGEAEGAQSNEITHVEGTPKTYVLKGQGVVELVWKDSAAALQPTGIYLASDGIRSTKVDCDGVVRWQRISGTCGVEQG